MKKVILETTAKGKPSLKLRERGDCIIRILKTASAAPFAEGSKRARAWGVVSLMDGLTLKEGHEIMKRLEPNIQGQSRPAYWLDTRCY